MLYRLYSKSNKYQRTVWSSVLSAVLIGLFLLTGADQIRAADFFIATDGSDDNPGTEARPWATLQKACDSLTPGSTVYVKAGTYNEKIYLEVSGTAAGGYITIRNYGTDEVIVDGTGLDDDNIIYLENRDYIKIIGLQICNNTGVNDGSGIRIEGSGSHIEIRNNKIHTIRGSDAMGITVYGTDAEKSISYLVVDGNEIYNCEPAHSEALTLNGNVENFEVTNNIVHDVNNIAIDFIGGEGQCPDSTKDVARNGLCSGNIVYNARSSYGGGYAAGIYIDGGNNITVGKNIVYSCDRGIELGCENRGWISSGNVMRNNLIYNNDKSGIAIGGYDYPRTGKVTDTLVVNNTCFNNDTLNTGTGELLIEYADSLEIKNNIFYCSAQNSMLTVSDTNTANTLTLDYNVWYSKSAPDSLSADWMGTTHAGYSSYVAATGQDKNSLSSDPLLVNPVLPTPDLHVQSDSPVIDAGEPGSDAAAGELDIDNATRVTGTAIDIGAYEYQQSEGSTTTTTLPATTTTTTSVIDAGDNDTDNDDDAALCPVEALYGDTSGETNLLRAYRDKVLSRTPAGRAVIWLYYQKSTLFTTKLQDHAAFKKSVKIFIEVILPTIRAALP